MKEKHASPAGMLAAGADVTLTEYAGMFHVFQLCGALLRESRAAWREVGKFLGEKLPRGQ